MNVLTSGIGEVHATAKTIDGIDHWNVDVRNYINILMSYHILSLYQVYPSSVGLWVSKLPPSPSPKT